LTQRNLPILLVLSLSFFSRFFCEFVASVESVGIKVFALGNFFTGDRPLGRFVCRRVREAMWAGLADATLPALCSFLEMTVGFVVLVENVEEVEAEVRWGCRGWWSFRGCRGGGVGAAL